MKRSAHNGKDPKSLKSGVKWDEDNLEENERIKQELNPRKIDEPKTPYLSPLQTEDEQEETLGVAPLSLNDDHICCGGGGGGGGWGDSAGAGPSRKLQISKSPWSDSSDAGYNNSTGSPSPRKPCSSAGRSPRFSEDYYKGESDDGEELMNPEVLERKRRFREARRHHYHFKEDLKRALQQHVDVYEEVDVGDGEGNGVGGSVDVSRHG